MNKLATKLGNVTYTENAALTNKSSGSVLLDLFGSIGAMRNRPEESILKTFGDALQSQPSLALKTLFYARDIRGGQGERKVFRTILKELAKSHPPLVIKNLNNIVEYGRWDDLFVLLDTPVEKSVFEFITRQFIADIAMLAKNKPVSLLAKWMPSENASSKATRALAAKTRNAIHEITGKELLGANSSKNYRKLLSKLRAAIRIVESKMCANDWENIEFDKVPSVAGLKYRKAFAKHQLDRYLKFMEDVKAGKVKVNAGVLFPYDIVKQILNGNMYKVGTSYYGGVCDVDDDNRKSLDMFWNNLPNYLENNPHNGLVVADTSGSMAGLPLAVSVSLAIYIAERNKGQFHNQFISFSQNPQFHKVEGADIVEKVANLSKTEWQQNTNLQRVFDLVLDIAVENKVPEKDMPESIYIISDMEFDTATEKNAKTNFQEISRKYSEAGYKMPELIFWNVASRNAQSPITIDENKNAKLVSGCSPSILTALLEGRTISAIDLMMNVLNSERYAKVTI